jgi:hypothetical protein
MATDYRQFGVGGLRSSDNPPDAPVSERLAESHDGVPDLVGCKEIIWLVPKAKYRPKYRVHGIYQSKYK